MRGLEGERAREKEMYRLADGALLQAGFGHQTEVDVREVSPLIKKKKLRTRRRGRRKWASPNRTKASKGTAYILCRRTEGLPMGDVWILRLDALDLLPGKENSDQISELTGKY